MIEVCFRKAQCLGVILAFGLAAPTCVTYLPVSEPQAGCEMNEKK